jgi:hypothetical protein
MYWIWKIYITKQFREIIYTKFRKIFSYFAKFRKIKYNKISRNFAEFREISWNKNHFRRYFVFREIKKSYFATTLPLPLSRTKVRTAQLRTK